MLKVEVTASQVEKSFVNGTNESVAHPKNWIAVLVQINREKSVALKLAKSGYETYVPTQSELHKWSDRRKMVKRILIPMVVFVRTTVRDSLWLRNQSFIYRLLAMPGSEESKKRLATIIPDQQIELLKFMLDNAETEVTVVSNLKVGDVVRVASGPLKGLEGVVSEADDKHSIVGVQINGLGYACVKLTKNYLSC